jgi:Flp pilus assembly protein TadD
MNDKTKARPVLPPARSQMQLKSTGLSLVLILSIALPTWGAAPDTASKTEPPGKRTNAPATASRIDEEIGGLRDGIRATPADAALHARLGYLLLRKGAVDEAKRSFDEALKLNPRSHAAMTGAGIVLARRGNLREAERLLQDALVQNPNPVRAHYELGLVYEKLGEFDKAVAEYKDGIKKFQQGRK